MALNKAPQPYLIQPLTPADVEAVLEIERLSFRSPWSRQVFAEELTRSWARVDVLREAAAGPGKRGPGKPGKPGKPDKPGKPGKIVAFCNYWLVADEIHLLNVATSPAQRRRGHATRLLAYVIENGKRAACRLVTLEVRRSNQAAQRLYARFAFKTVGIRPNYYVDDGEDAVVMNLELG